MVPWGAAMDRTREYAYDERDGGKERRRRRRRAVKSSGRKRLTM